MARRFSRDARDGFAFQTSLANRLEQEGTEVREGESCLERIDENSAGNWAEKG